MPEREDVQVQSRARFELLTEAPTAAAPATAPDASLAPTAHDPEEGARHQPRLDAGRSTDEPQPGAIAPDVAHASVSGHFAVTARGALGDVP